MSAIAQEAQKEPGRMIFNLEKNIQYQGREIKEIIFRGSTDYKKGIITGFELHFAKDIYAISLPAFPPEPGNIISQTIKIQLLSPEENNLLKLFAKITEISMPAPIDENTPQEMDIDVLVSRMQSTDSTIELEIPRLNQFNPYARCGILINNCPQHGLWTYPGVEPI